MASRNTIVEHAEACEAAFASITRDEDAPIYVVAESLRQRFEQWSSNMGVFANTQFSLDTRLGHSDSLHSMVLDLLELMKTGLYRIKHMQNQAVPDAMSREVISGEAQGTGSKTLSVSEMQGDFIKQMVHDPAKIGSVLIESLRTVKSVVDSLNRLGSAIRQSASAERLTERIRNYMQKTDDGGFLEETVYFRLKTMLVDRRKEEYGQLPVNAQGGTLLLCRQLAISVAYRYYTIMYRRNHEQKRTMRHENKPDGLRRDIHEGKAPEPVVVLHDKKTPPPDLTKRPSAIPKHLLSAPSERTGTSLSRPESAAVRKKYASSQASFEGARSAVSQLPWYVTLPKPPKIVAPAVDAACPYCLQRFSKGSYENKGWWEDHIKRELKLYTCISEDCRQPPLLFANYTEWKKHMDDTHTEQWTMNVHPPVSWWCDLGHDEEIFSEEEGYKSHMVVHHQDEIEGYDMDDLKEHATAKQPRTWNTCPVCNCIPSRIRSSSADTREIPTNEFQLWREELLKHVGQHLVEIGLLSVSYLGDDNNDEGGSGASRNVSIQSRGSMPKSEMDDDVWGFDDTRLADNDGIYDESSEPVPWDTSEWQVLWKADLLDEEHILRDLVDFAEKWRSPLEVEQCRNALESWQRGPQHHQSEPLRVAVASHGVHLLALDGGGVRGLSALLILQQLMERVNPDSPPLPCDYFDMIGGTSTGGLIAIMLGRLRMTVDECIEAYVSLSDEVFTTKRHRFSFTGKIQVRFDSNKLEQAIKRVIKKRGLGEDTLLKDDGPCKVFVCATSKEIADTVCLRSYRTARGGDDRLAYTKIWEACRATSAATTFFDPITIGPFGEGFVDGALGSNNPVRVLYGEYQDVFGSRGIKCLVSIGVGVPPVRSVGDSFTGIFKVFRDLATETERTAEDFQRIHDKGYYYRFNVTRGLENIELEEAGKKKEIAAATRRYIESQAVFRQFETCAKILAGGTYLNPSNAESPKTKHHLPFYMNHNFVGREDELKQLQTLLFNDAHPADAYQVVALCGLGGIGKTQVANALAHWTKQNKKDHSVFWVPAIGEPDFEKAYMTIARKLGIPESVDQDVKTIVCDHLSSEEAGKWLLVIDNLDDPSLVKLQQFFPKSDSGRILVTTRKKEVSLGVAQKTLQLSAFDLPQAKQLATKILHPDLLGDDASVDALLKELEYLPLAITQATAFINQTRMPAAKYLGLLRNTEEDKVDLLGNELQDNTRYGIGSRHAVATTWLVSFGHLQEKSPDAIKLLEFLSQIQPKAIPESLLGSNAATSIAISRLCDYSFVSWQNDNVLDMHSLVHMATRSWVKKNGHSGKVVRDALHRMYEVFPNSDYDNRDTWRAYLPHALYMFRSGKAVDSVEVLSLYIRVGHCLQADGRIKEALQCFQYCTDWACESLPEDDPYRLSSQHALAGVYRADGQIAKAVELLEHVVRVEGKTLAEDHSSRLASQHELAIVYESDGQIAKAVELLEHVVRVEGKTLAEDHPNRLASQHELAGVYVADGQIAKAVELLKHVVRIREKTLAEDHPDRLASQHELAIILWGTGNKERAIELMRRVVKGWETLLNHPNGRLARKNLAKMEKNFPG